MRPRTACLDVAPGWDPTARQLAGLWADLADPSTGPSVVVLVEDECDAGRAEELRAQLEAADVDGLATLRPHVDALKEVDGEGVVVGAVDRSRHARLGYPQVVSASALASIVEAVDPASRVNPAAALLSAGATVRPLRSTA